MRTKINDPLVHNPLAELGGMEHDAVYSFLLNAYQPGRGTDRDAFHEAVDDLNDFLRCEFQAGVAGKSALGKASVTIHATINRVAGVTVGLMDFETIGLAERAMDSHVGPPLDIGGKKPDNPYRSYGVG
ncbi:MAG TPA: hypothetical protein VG028_01995 [Terriglobia bacterium]|nr:hypothetical protein [Terriglobia bacterium]